MHILHPCRAVGRGARGRLLLFIEEGADGAEGREDGAGFVGDVDGFVVFAGGHLAQGVDVLHGQHVGGGVGLALGDGFGDAAYGLGLGAGVEDYGLGVAFGTQDFALLVGLGLVYLRGLLAFGA